MIFCNKNKFKNKNNKDKKKAFFLTVNFKFSNGIFNDNFPDIILYLVPKTMCNIS